jgi:hypothetical protein
MMQSLLLLLSILIPDGRSLHVGPVNGARTLPVALIVGRASCSHTAWLLTESRQLIEVPLEASRAAIHPVVGLQPLDRVWGLACLADGSLWTLAEPRVMARLDSEGRVRERVATTLPRVALFAAGHELLFQQLPITTHAAALLVGPPRKFGVIREWRGLSGRSADTRARQMARNLVSCGVGIAGTLPCWFTDDRRFTVSDGLVARTIVPPLNAAETNPEAPIWDVALAGTHYWLLAGGQTSARLAGERLLRVQENTGAFTSIRLDPPVRVILSATETRCRLLNVNGQLLEVTLR